MRRHVFWLVFGVVVAGGLAVIIPGSPAYLPSLLVSPDQYEGRSARYWIKALGSPDPAARRQAAHALGAIGSAEAVPALADILTDDPDPELRGEAALALFKIGPAAKAAVPALARGLSDSEPQVRMSASVALHRLGAESRPAVPELLRALGSRDNDVYLSSYGVSIREMAALALGRASAGTADGVPVLIDALETASTTHGRRSYAAALGDVGPPALPAVPVLTLIREEDDLREDITEAIRKIQGSAPGPDADDSALEMTLPEAERKYLWEVEHHGNRLSKDGFGRLADAIRAADAAALARFLADDFTWADLQAPHRVRSAGGVVEIERLLNAGRPPATLGRVAFVNKLLGYRALFPASPPQVKLALMTLSPRIRGRLDGPWEGTAQLRLHGDHAPGAPAEVVAVLRYEVPRPTAEALAGPGWLRAASVVRVQTSRAPHYLFAEVARDRGLDPGRLHDNWVHMPTRTTTGGVYVCDYDRDGRLDLLVTDVNGTTLYRGRPGGRFEDVTTALGLPAQAPQRAAAWVDLDGDGWDDLLLGGRVYRNDAGRRFIDVTGRCNLRLPADASAVLPADYDRDGRLDLYVTRPGRPGRKSWLAGHSADPRGNYLYRNAGDWKFEDVTRASGAMGGHRSSFTAAWLDSDDDGWPDLFVPNEFGDAVLLVNNHDGTFAERPLADRPADFGTMGLAVGDVDNDGRIDVYSANMYSKAGTRVIGNVAPDAYPPAVMEKLRRFVAGSQLHLNKGGGKFDQVGQARQVNAVGWAYGAALADLDNDGYLDIYATAGFASRNRTEPDG